MADLHTCVWSESVALHQSAEGVNVNISVLAWSISLYLNDFLNYIVIHVLSHVGSSLIQKRLTISENEVMRLKT